MKKSLFYQLTGAGKPSEEMVQKLEDDDVAYLEEGVKASIIFRGVMGPRSFFCNKKTAAAGSIGFSEHFFLVFIDYFSNQGKNHLPTLIHLKKKIFKQLKFKEFKKTLSITYDVSFFNSEEMGEIEMRFHVDNIKSFRRFFNVE